MSVKWVILLLLFNISSALAGTCATWTDREGDRWWECQKCDEYGENCDLVCYRQPEEDKPYFYGYGKCPRSS